MPAELWTLLGALAGGGLLVHLVDRWVYRRRPRLDVAALAQQVAATAVENARRELAAAYADAAQARQEAAELRAELAAARVEIARLTSLLETAGRQVPSVNVNLSAPAGAAMEGGGPA